MRLALFTIGALLALQIQTAGAQTTAPVTPPSQQQPADGQSQGQRHAKLMKLIQELNLSQDQLSQIKQIRQSTPDKKQRRQQIMAVLTPEQRAQLKQLRGQGHRGQGSGAPTNSAPANNPDT